MRGKSRPFSNRLVFLSCATVFAVFANGCAATPYEVPAKRVGDSRNTVSADMTVSLQAVLDRAVNENKMPGLQAAAILPDGAVWVGASGTTDFKRTAPLRTDHLFRVASMTKLYTAALVMLSVERGELALDDRLSKWLPNYKRADEITVGMLLQHTSGLPDTFEKLGTLLRAGLFPRALWTPKELVAAHDKPLHFDPGTGWKYSNANYIFLGLILESVTGKPFNEILRRDILVPNGLPETFFAPSDTIPPRLVSGFDRALMPYPNEHPPTQLSWASLAHASGAIVSSAWDLAHFTRALFSGRIVTPKTLARMTEFVPTTGTRAAWTGYGLGIVRCEIGGVEYWGHEGLFIGFEGYTLYNPEKGCYLSVIGNMSTFNHEKVVAELGTVIRSYLH
jgi:D-alanyl-D-alanine carboxypeptidase